MSRTSYYLDGRLFEWVMSIGAILLSVEIYIWPHTLRASSFQWITQLVPETYVGLILLAVGMFRCGALIANGSSMVIGPRVRAIGALFGSIIWLQFALALCKLSIDQHFASPGLPFWFIFTLAEIRIIYRAGLDVRTPY